MTIVSLLGCRSMPGRLPQSNVLIATMIITATSAPIGMMRTRSPSSRIIANRNTPATKVLRRVRAPLPTLMIDWPIMAQPAMPPKQPVTTFARPWPRASRFLSLSVSVRSSTMFAVSSDSISPTSASGNA